MTETKCAKGFYIQAIVKYVDTTFEASKARRFHEALSPATKTALSQMSRGEWYDMVLFDEITDNVIKLCDNEEHAFEELKKCGIFVGQDATGTFLKLLIKVLTPRMFALKFPTFWSRYHNHGGLIPDVSEIDKNHLRLHVMKEGSYRAVAAIGSGWIDNAFTAMGKKDVRVIPHPARFIEPGTEAYWDVYWT